VTGTIDLVRFAYRGSVVAQHARCWGKHQVTMEPLHYLALLEQKPFALDWAKPMQQWTLPDCFTALRRRLEEADPTEGTRKYIRVLRLLESWPLPVVTKAVTAALRLGAIDADAVRLLVEKANEHPQASSLDLSDRPRLLAVNVPTPDLTAYRQLTGAKARKKS
jgi:hypothetical protein